MLALFVRLLCRLAALGVAGYCVGATAAHLIYRHVPPLPT